MKASEYVAYLHQLIAEHGNLEIMATDNSRMNLLGAAQPAQAPRIAFMKLLTGREHIQKFAMAGDIQTEKVIRI